MIGRRIMTADEIRRATIRLSHEIVEKQAGTDGLLLIGIQRRGVPLARRIAAPSSSTRVSTSRSGRSTSRSTATTCRWSRSSPWSRAPSCRRASTDGRSSSSTTCSTPAGRSGRRWTPWSTSADHRPSAWPWRRRLVPLARESGAGSRHPSCYLRATCTVRRVPRSGGSDAFSSTPRHHILELMLLNCRRAIRQSS